MSIILRKVIVRGYWREWIFKDDYGKLIKPVDRDAIINEVLKEQAAQNLDVKSKYDKVMKFMDVKNIKNYVKEFPTFDRITTLKPYYDIKLFDFTKELVKNTNIKVTVFKKI